MLASIRSVTRINRHTGTCTRCKVRVEPRMGAVFRNPLRLVCALCSPDDNGIVERLKQFPLKYEGEEINLLPFQVEDARLIARARSILIGHQMGCGKCSYKDTLVQLNGTLIEAQEAWSSYARKPFFDGEGWWATPSEPLFVNSLDNETGKIVRGRVTRLYRQRVREKLRRIKLDDGSQVTITQAHKLYKADEWTNELQAGDRACVPARLLHEEGEFDPELAELFGWMIGDGHENRFTSKTTMVVTQKLVCELDRIRTLIQSVSDRFHLSLNVIVQDHDGTGRASDVRVTNAGFRAFCESHDYPWGTLSKDRRVPRPIMQAGPGPLRKFLRAYMDADGSVPNGCRYVEFSSASQRLVKEVSVLLRRFGVWVRIRKKRARATNSPTCPYRDYWIGSFGGPSARRYLKEIGFGVDYKQAELERLCSYKTNTNTEGVSASSLVGAAFKRSGLPASHFGLDPAHGLSTVYLKGTQEFSRESLAVVVQCMDEVLSGSKEEEVRSGRETRWKSATLAAYAELDYGALREARDRAQRLIDQEVFYAKVVAVEEVDYDGWVYDFEIKQHHNYIAESVLCHNTVMACVAALRSDTPNLVFVPSSVKCNWGREIKKWRPDLIVKHPTRAGNFQSSLSTVLQTPGHVLVSSHGMLPGNPCRGCASLREYASALKKEERMSQRPSIECTHTEPGVPHPETAALIFDGRRQAVSYHGFNESGHCEFCNDPNCEGPPYPEAPPKGMQGKVRQVHCASCRRRGCPGKQRCCPGCWQVNPVPELEFPVVLLGDEIHAFKNPKSQRTKNWRAMKNSVRAAGGYVFGLSGTPCEGKPPEFWEVLISLGLEKAAFENWAIYYQIFQGYYDNKKGRRSPPQDWQRSELHRRLKLVQVRRMRAEVLKDLPPRIDETIVVEMDDKTANQVNEAVHHMLAVSRAWEDIRNGRGADRLLNPSERGLTRWEKERRKQFYENRVEWYFKERPWNTDEEIANAVREALLHRDSIPTIDQLAKIRAMLSQAKVAAVMEWLRSCEEQDEPVVLFSQHVSIIKKIAQSRPGWDVFHGGLTAKKRDLLVQDFQAGKVKNGLAVSIGAGGEGITLTRARVCGFIDLSWNPARNFQAESRLIRIGAEVHDSILIVRFVADHAVDRLVMETLREKEAILSAMDPEPEIFRIAA